MYWLEYIFSAGSDLSAGLSYLLFGQLGPGVKTARLWSKAREKGLLYLSSSPLCRFAILLPGLSPQLTLLTQKSHR